MICFCSSKSLLLQSFVIGNSLRLKRSGKVRRDNLSCAISLSCSLIEDSERLRLNETRLLIDMPSFSRQLPSLHVTGLRMSALLG